MAESAEEHADVRRRVKTQHDIAHTLSAAKSAADAVAVEIVEEAEEGGAGCACASATAMSRSSKRRRQRYSAVHATAMAERTTVVHHAGLRGIACAYHAQMKAWTMYSVAV
mmetsp:Transcript_6916/g.18503  ORF Transcript_6916/g.18503 Transcript_6916/m.18503 type:complete len:111 (-) Transcript_6916:290-622(-)